ncbi:MFS transporter [Desulfoscipio geothermicus]|uniref:Major Facilitator Superfamily protein n=1 Tax=Desulfoscipio geothermicus DSM 3669 TaxID=1121426 RepID=A0A1I6D7E3_9FIRM|nr:MFS transporter [Desulfoscipio geothermicus]SFR01375.1 Major Facilitator Superfamily protein [Desulfoscipio geothermicus DSM 3669]
MAGVEPLLPLHLSREFGLGAQGIGIVFGVLGIFYTLFEPLMGLLSDRLGYKNVILGGLAGTAMVMPVLTIVDSLPLLYVVICLYSLVFCAMMVPCLPLLAEHSDAGGGENYGRQFGLANAAYSTGLLLGPAVGGLVAHYISFLGATLVYSALLAVPGVLVLRRYRPNRV